ncbi:hypothetical protein LCGC14_3096380 [marine sediment metagenome]|uniref:Uncharacterized protein n=1 Tax=marine sediment metagenome TaxID=412755 RepID=A0A0F8WXV0_9ZZZZ
MGRRGQYYKGKFDGKKEQLEDFMNEIETAKQGYTDQVWSGEECLVMLHNHCTLKLKEYELEKQGKEK